MKKRVLTRVLSVVLVVMTVVALVPMGGISVGASANDITREQAVEWAEAQASNPKDYDGAYGVQCVDLAVAYYKYLGKKSPGGNGRDYATNKLPSGWTRIENSYGFVPKPGDIAVWTKTGSVYGHVAIVLYADLSTLTVAEFLGSNHTARIHTYSYSYGTFYGVIRPDFPESSVSSNYSFNFNANGGTLGNTGDFTALYGQEFQILNTTCTRDGYTWAGWNVKRNTDNTWYVDGYGWCTEATIKDNSYSKKIFSNSQNETLNSTWTNGISGDASYTFYAVWSKERDTRLRCWVSEYGSGSNVEQSVIGNNGTTQTEYYFWYKLYDYSTGDLHNTYDSRDYTVTMNVYDSSGSSVYSAPVTYSRSDMNCCSWIPKKADVYTCEFVLSGGWQATVTRTLTVDYNAYIALSTEDVALKLNESDSQSVTVSACGGIPGKYGVRFEQDNSNVSLSWGSFDGNSIPLYVSANSEGNTTVVVYIYENYSGNKEIIAEASFDVTVTSNSYTINYDANGGSNTPASQTKTHGRDVTITSAIPTGKTYTVIFDGNGGTVSTSSKQFTQTFVEWNIAANGLSTSYPSGSVYSGNSSITLYAEWNNPTFSATDPTRSGYYFLGWYDSIEVDDYGLPVGNKYVEGDEILSNLTLYALWGTSPMMLFGDYNLDGIIEFIPDASGFNNYRLGLLSDLNNAELNFRGDVNADGIVDFSDIELISQVANGTINYTDLPAYQRCAGGLILNIYPKRTYAYGEAFDDSDLSFIAYYSATAYHEVTDNIVVTGYDPYKIGTQTVTISYYQYKETMTVTVNAPEYSVYYNANGGNNAPSSQSKVQGTNLTLSTTIPTRSGYTFMGWATSSSATTASYQAGGTYSNNANVILHAVWKANTYTVTYNANGGSNAPVSQTKVHGTNLTLSSTVPTRTGYTFMGWATSSNATVSSYDASGTYSSNGNVTFYAVWIKNTYTITYNANGGSNAPTIQTKYYGTNITLSKGIPNKEGYSFIGWSTSNDETVEYQVGATYTENTSIILYAVWKANEYTVSYDVNGGSNIPASQTKIYETALTLSDTVPVKTGYTFIGWAETRDAISAIYQAGGTYTNNADVTLYAVWKQDVDDDLNDNNDDDGLNDSKETTADKEMTDNTDNTDKVEDKTTDGDNKKDDSMSSKKSGCSSSLVLSVLAIVGAFGAILTCKKRKED